MADAYSSNTTKQRLPTPLNGTIYTTTRVVASEKPLPAIGSTMESELGPTWNDSYVIGTSDGPDSAKGILTITHVRIPSEDDQLGSNWEQVQVAIGGKQFPGVVRSVILLASEYEDDAPAVDSDMPVIAGGLFDGDGYVLYDRECVKSGMELEPTFRVDRRTFVSTRAIVGEQFAPDGAILASTDSIVNEGTAADTGALVADSSVNANGTGKAAKQTRTAKRRKTDGTKEDGWPKKQSKSKGVENLTPQKFRALTTTTTTTEQVELVAANVDNIPDPATPTGDQTVIEHEKVNDYRIEKRITTEVIDENAAPLVGYKLDGDGQVATVTETLIVTGGPDDTITGSATTLDASTDPLGNGKSIKTEVEIAAILPKYQYSADNNPSIAPEKFRTNPGEVSVSYTSTGSASQPTLTGTYSARSEKQINQFTKQVSFSQILSNTTGIVRGTSVDPRTGEVFADDQEVVASSAVTLGGSVDASGNVVLYDGYDANWSVKTTRRVASTTSQTWEDIVNYEWPPVLLSISFKIFEAKSGESVIYPVVRFRQGFQGPQKATVTQYWSKTNPGVVPAISMIPEGFKYQCPLYQLGVPPCLHTSITMTCNIGTSDPDWEMATDSETFPATNYTDWPDSVFWRESKPDRGGYLITEYTINKPA